MVYFPFRKNYQTGLGPYTPSPIMPLHLSYHDTNVVLVIPCRICSGKTDTLDRSCIIRGSKTNVIQHPSKGISIYHLADRNDIDTKNRSVWPANWQFFLQKLSSLTKKEKAKQYDNYWGWEWTYPHYSVTYAQASQKSYALCIVYSGLYRGMFLWEHDRVLLGL